MSENNGTNIEYLSYLDEHGALLQPLPTPLQNRETLTQLYRTLVTSRLFDETIINLQRVGIIGTYASNRGQEAIGTAIGKAMLKDDVFIPYYRDICAQIQRGVQLEEILQYWGGDERGRFQTSSSRLPPLCTNRHSTLSCNRGCLCPKVQIHFKGGGCNLRRWRHF